MPARKRDRYGRAARKTKGPAPDAVGAGPSVPRTTVSIDRRAGKGRSGLGVGDRVRIVGSGLFSGEIAVIERLTGSVVPAAFVRTEGGRTRQVRTIDLEPVADAVRRSSDEMRRHADAETPLVRPDEAPLGRPDQAPLVRPDEAPLPRASEPSAPAPEPAA